jgi:hypothetical protein
VDYGVADSGGVEPTQCSPQARRLLGMINPGVVPVQFRVSS